MSDIGDGVLLEATSIGSGTGNYDSFFRLQATGVEQGFNTDQNGKVLDDKASFTHSLQWGNLQPITVNGIQYIEFRLDLNENVNANITLTDLRVYISNHDATITDYDAGFSGFVSVFDMPGTQLLTDSNSGSGTDDYRVLVPVSSFLSAGATSSSYVTLYSSFSGSDGGFEEWRTTTVPSVSTQPGIAIDKQTVDGAVSGDGLNVLAGDSISWKYTVTNTGNVALSNVVVTDDHNVVVSPVLSSGFNIGDTNHDNKLDTTETWIFTGSGTAISGNYSNIGTVTASTGTGTVTDFDPSNYFGADPKITIDKVTADDTASGDGLNILSGEAISWKYTVTNTGNVALSGVAVSDSDAGVTPVAVLADATHNIGDTDLDGVFDIGESWVFTASGTSQAGAYENTGTATSSYQDDAGHSVPVTAHDDSSYFGADPKITIDKVTVDDTASGDGLNILSGEAISWKYTVTNTGNVALSGVAVSDSDAGVTPVAVLADATHNIGDTDLDGVFGIGESWVFTASGTSQAGAYENTGTATSSYQDDAGHSVPVTAHDDSSYFGADPHITLDKKTNGVDHGLDIFQGQAVTWTYDVTNDGNVALTNVVVKDDNGTPLNPSDDFNATAITSSGFNTGDGNLNGVFDIGETWHYQATGTAQVGSYVNNATATTDAYTDTAEHSRTPSATDSSDYEGFSNKALTQGFWGSHTDVWDNVGGNEGNPSKSAYASGVLSSLDVNPSKDDLTTAKIDESKYLLLGDTNSDGIANDTHDLWISISLAKSIESASAGGDARLIMLQQAIATQLNINNGVAQPDNLIDEAVMWLKSQGAWSTAGANLDANNDGFIDTNGAGTALLGNALKTNTNAWTKYVDVTDPAGITDWNGGKEADGEGLKNALMWFNQGQLVTSGPGPGGHVAWFNGTSIVDDHPNTLDQFWVTLHEVVGLTGIS